MLTQYSEIMANKTIFMVDDDRDFLESQSVILKHLGYNVVTCNSSYKAFDMARETHPDLFILDVNMEKEFSGFELHRQFRATKEMAETPIIMLTGIVTYDISNHLIEMYRDMRSKDDFEISKVLKIHDGEKDLAIEYFDEEGTAVILPLDAFISKSDVDSKLIPQVKTFLGDQ